MEQEKLSLKLNFSSQSNMGNAIDTHLSQFSFLAIFGNRFLNKLDESKFKIPLRININKSGELSIDGLDEEVLIKRGEAQVYSDKKITCK
ncbi:MAG: hypothetical protein ACOYWZ_14780 [Bacillota bacterium]